MATGNPSVYTTNTIDSASAIRRLAAQLLQLVEEIDSGQVKAVAGGAGMVARLRNGWEIDLQMSFTRVACGRGESGARLHQ